MTERLLSLADTYRAAVGARDPRLLPITKSVRYTENGHELALDEGVWATATAAPEPLLTVADPALDAVVEIGRVTEGMHDFVYGTRIGVLAGEVSEIETVIVTKRSALNLLGADEFLRHRPEREHVTPEQKRTARDRLVDIAHRYYDGVLAGDSSGIPLARGCVRRVNGIRTAPREQRVRDLVIEEWGLPDLGPLTVAEKIDSGIHRYIDAIEQRRVLAVDEERQTIVMASVFRQDGLLTAIPELGLETLPAPMRQPCSMLAFEVFMIDDGEITAVESISAHTPLGTTHGWRATDDPVVATGGRVT